MSLALILTACADLTDVTGPEVKPTELQAVARVTCTADTKAETLSCAPATQGEENSAITSSRLRRVVLGGQGEYVQLTSANIQVYADTFAFDVTLQNLISQALGTVDGRTIDPAGVRVFFASGPTSTGPGAVTVANPDGIGTFTASSQPYFEYHRILDSHEVTAAKRWKLRFTPEVANFAFTLFVSAEVEYPQGYVDGTPLVISLDPGETRVLPGIPRSVTGREITGETITWLSDDPQTAVVSGDQVTAVSSRGVTVLTASSGARPALHETRVSVCQSLPVGGGSAIPAAIENTDCFSTYGDSDGLPTADYYADLYRLPLAAGQTVTITMESDDLDTYLILAEAESGLVVGYNDDDPTNELVAWSRVEYTALRSGVFVIEASTYAGLATGTYTLRVLIS